MLRASQPVLSHASRVNGPMNISIDVNLLSVQIDVPISGRMASIQVFARRKINFAHHEITNEITNNYGKIAVEDLKIKNMTATASGTVEDPGSNVAQKAGLNRVILERGWGNFFRQLEYKSTWKGGELVKVDPQYTSQQCSQCGHTSSENRKVQEKFSCVECGHSENADINAAKNILQKI